MDVKINPILFERPVLTKLSNVSKIDMKKNPDPVTTHVEMRQI